MSDIVERLRQAAKEIRAAGHNGWGNTCEDAADMLERTAVQPTAATCTQCNGTGLVYDKDDPCPKCQLNTGHGHVRKRPDGVRMRCGGPGICAVCSREAAAVKSDACPDCGRGPTEIGRYGHADDCTSACEPGCGCSVCSAPDKPNVFEMSRQLQRDAERTIYENLLRKDQGEDTGG
jgi:hypothetical protein